MSDGENLVIAIGAMVVVVGVLSGMFGFIDDSNNAEECELEWVDCTDDDRIGDCEEHTEEIVTGPYWNETTEIKITLRKQICEEQGD